mgnify:CR=1 FL=1
MNRKLITITAFAIVATHSLGQTYLNPEAPLEERVKDALSRMHRANSQAQACHASAFVN